MTRAAIAILSTSNLLNNIAKIRDFSGGAKIISMVKANAYGHGIRSVGQRLDGTVDILGVASLDEALILRGAGVKAEILITQGPYNFDELMESAKNNFQIVVHNHEQLKWLHSHLPNPMNIWLKINTGMGRLGFNLLEAEIVYNKLMEHKNCQKPLKIMSHFACADNVSHQLNAQQVLNFQNFIKGKEAELSMCNSAAIINFPDFRYNYIRPGIFTYGVSPIAGKIASSFGLKPVMTVKSDLISVQNFSKGTNVGYGALYQCEENMPVGIVAFGYGDGYPMTAQNGAPILVKDKKCSIIGRVSMDMLAVDLRAYPNAKIGDEVTLWGEGLPLEHLVEYTKNIAWDILTTMQYRVKFTWKE